MTTKKNETPTGTPTTPRPRRGPKPSGRIRKLIAVTVPPERMGEYFRMLDSTTPESRFEVLSNAAEKIKPRVTPNT